MTTMTMKPRPTTYAGIKMRSRLEALFAEALDREGICWTYEPQCFAGPDGQYLPDFELEVECFEQLSPPGDCGWVCVLSPPWVGPIYVDVKPTLEKASAPELARKMEVIHDSEPGAQLLSATPDLPYFPWALGGQWLAGARPARCCECQVVALVQAYPAWYYHPKGGSRVTWQVSVCPYCIDAGRPPGVGHLHPLDFDFRWRG